MSIFVVGINHRTAPVEIREKLSFPSGEIARANRTLKENSGFSEGLILSTCNRVEIYGVINGVTSDFRTQVQSFLSQFHDIDIAQFKDRLYFYEDDDAVAHLFKVAAGLDSMVIGEMEILGQVKKAYHDARNSKTTGKVLNRLLQKAFNTAKKIRTDTFITRGSVSVSSVAVKLAEKILGDLKNKKALIIGTGQVGEQLLSYLKKNGVQSIMVANRTFQKAQDLADRFGAGAVKFEDFPERLCDADIVIASTGAPHCIIKQEDIHDLMPRRKQRPVFIIDLAVPRDVDSGVNKIDNVYLYDIDDLDKIVDKNRAFRKGELDNCNKILDISCARFRAWLVNERIIDAK